MDLLYKLGTAWELRRFPLRLSRLTPLRYHTSYPRANARLVKMFSLQFSWWHLRHEILYLLEYVAGTVKPDTL
jgi:hypothetical protein